MKNVIKKPGLLIVALLLIYVAGLFLGAFAVISFPVYLRQQSFFRMITQSIAQEYLVGETASQDEMTSPNTYILIYDRNGDCVQYVPPTNAPTEQPPLSLDKHVSTVLAGKAIYRPVFLSGRTRGRVDIIVMTGMPMFQNESVEGAVFLLKGLVELPATIAGFSVYFTIFYWVSALVIASNLRKRQRLNELQRTYIANVTHALKTPVASIKALSETLCDEVEPDPGQQKVYYGMILREANRQDHMIRDILELSKLQSHGMDFSKTKLFAAELLAPIQEKYATLCDCMDVQLHISDSVSHLPALYSNAACVRQIFEILLDNALKFVSEGGNIWLEASIAGKTAVFCVRDDGIGIEKDALPQVFDRFFKGSHDFNSSGSGLGLAIAQEITAGLKERIWAESEVGSGSSFFFTVHLK